MAADRVTRRALVAWPVELPRGRLALLAAGKAAAGMAVSFVSAAPRRPDLGLVIGLGGPRALPAPLAWLPGTHPVPDARSVEAATRALALATSLTRDDHLLVLLSGGASAMMAAPVEQVTLADKQATTRALLGSGADIAALNCVRKHLSRVKGGRLAAACRGQVTAWLLSDVPGDDPSVIGSGPTVPDPTTFADALAIVRGLHGGAAIPRAVVEYLERGVRGEARDTLKPGDPAAQRATARVIGSRHDAMRGAADAAVDLGYAVTVQEAPVVGEARLAGGPLVQAARRAAARLGRPACYVASGETTVTVTGKGTGGRNQELALGASAALAGIDVPMALVSVGTDGIDGPTDAAGGWVDSTTATRARATGWDIDAALAGNDAWTLLDRLGDLVRTGPTGTNVGDLQLVLTAP